MAKFYTAPSGRCYYLARIHGELYTRLQALASARGKPASTLLAELLAQTLARQSAAGQYTEHPDASCYYLATSKNVSEATRARQVKITAEEKTMGQLFALVEKTLAEKGYSKPEGFDEAQALPEEQVKALADYPRLRNYRRAFDKRCREVLVNLLVTALDEQE